MTFATISGAGIAEYLRPSSATQSPCFSINLFLKTSGDLLGSTGTGLGVGNICFKIGDCTPCGSFHTLSALLAPCIPPTKDDGNW